MIQLLNIIVQKSVVLTLLNTEIFQLDVAAIIITIIKYFYYH